MPRRVGQSHEWPTRGRMGYIANAAWVVQLASEWGTNSQVFQQ